MNKNRFAYSFHIFDGEGGMGASGAEASMSGPAQGMDEQPQIVYGKDPRGNGQAMSQVGSDNAAQGMTPEAEFAELIGKGGRFHDIYGQTVSKAIQDRFKNQADLQAQMNDISEGLSPLFMNYGLETGDFEGLSNAIAQDDAFFKANAEKAGLDVEQYKHQLQLEAEAERGRRITEQYEEQQRRTQMFTRWESEAQVLQQQFPNFDLGLEIENNPAFANYLNYGASVNDAFLLSHMNEIVGGMNNAASQQATQNVVSAIQQRAARPPENGLSMHNPAIQRRSDPSQLTDEDFDEINRIVSEGGTVSF
jgi:hypothetical protein